MRRTVALLAVLAVVAAGCGGGDEREELPSEWVSLAKAAEPWEGETLRLIGEALPPLEALDKVKSEFEEETGVTVVIEQLGHEEVIEKTTADFAGQTGTYDLILNPHREIGRLVANEWVRPLEEFMNDPALRDPAFDPEGSFVNQRWFEETCMYQGQIYGMPFHQISMYLWWRYDLLEHPEEQQAFQQEYGYELPAPPVTWDEYRDVAEFFTRSEGETLAGETLDRDFYGNAVQGGRHVAAWYWWLNLLYSFGGREMDLERGDQADAPVTVNSSEAVASLEFAVDLLEFSPPGSTTYTWDEAQAAQQQDIAALGIQWDDATFAVEDPEQSVVAGKMAYSGTPIGEEKMTQIEGWSYFIPATSEKPELAWLFMQWAMGPTAQVAQQLGGGESGLKVTYEDPEVQDVPYVPTALYIKSEDRTVLSERAPGADNGLGVPTRYLEAQNPATGDTDVAWVPKPTFPEQEEMVEILVLAVNRAMTGAVTPQEALDEAQAEIETLLE